MTAQTARRTGVADPLAMPATVVATRRLSEHMARVTVRCADLDKFDYAGPDHLVRIFLPPEPRGGLNLPVGARWWPEVLAMPEPERPIVRNYTVRAIDRPAGELDIDFVLHGDAGPASAWARRAAPGDRIGLLSDGARFDPPPGVRRLLLVGDETALPAIAATLEQLEPSAEALVLLEVDTPHAELPLPLPPGVELRWLHRAPAGAARGALVLDH
ncbi:MAG: siderophore-interacting protein, partial [Thermocrispum sp.]